MSCQARGALRAHTWPDIRLEDGDRSEEGGREGRDKNKEKKKRQIA